MRRGFSLIELVVSLGIMIILSGGAMVYISNFGAKQKLTAAQKEVVEGLRLARSYAITSQMPDNGELEYVGVEVADRVMTARANGVGSSYFSRELSPTGIDISLNKEVWFSVYEGKLLKDAGGVTRAVESDYGAKIVISSSETGSTLTVNIEPTGLINEN